MHYEVELRRPETAWRAVRLVRPRTFATLDAARAHAGRLGDRETRIVVVEHDGSRRVVDADEA